MRVRDYSIPTLIALFLAVVGVGLGVTAMIVSNPYLGLFAITVVCAGGVSAIIGLQPE